MKLRQAEWAAIAVTAAFLLLVTGIRIGRRGRDVPVTVETARYTAAHAAASEAPLRSLPQEAEAEPVNLNTATQAELETLTGVGPVLAARIIDYRETHGPFARTEDITRVQGIAEKVFADNAGRMTVDGGGETE
jgi:competence protein ComEA